MSFNDSMSGYKKLENTKNFTTEQLFEKFKEIKVSFGEPSMGTMTGDPAVVWKIDHFVVYVKADPKNVQIGGVIGEKIGINLDNTALQRLDKYAEMLVETNKSLNLTAITEPDEILYKLVISMY